MYKFSYTSIEGKAVNLSEYEGKVLLIVNVASKCGFTPQYEGLETLYRRYRERGFEVIGFPCNQFSEQEPGTELEIAEFCSARFDVTFPLSQKVKVRESGAIPLYKYLTEQKPFEGFVDADALKQAMEAKYKETFADNQVKWNFTKFLIGKDGAVAARYESNVEPESIAGDIEKLL
jgi:glutathione peroxidase